MTDNYLRRLNYTNGQLLDVSDFTNEQDYHLKMRRRHNQLVHTWGIVAGLEVAAVDGDTDLVIKPGMAIDKEGREIVLIGPETEPVKLKDKTPPLRGTTFFLTLAYNDDEKDMAVKDKGNLMYYRRKLERPLIGFPTTAPATDGSVITLAKVTVEANGKVTFDPSARSRSVSSRIDPVADLTVRSLLANGNVGVGTNDPGNYKLKVQSGDTYLDGKLTVSGSLTVSAEGSLSFGSQVRQMINLWKTVYGIGIQASTQYYRTDKNFAWY
jgi:hypothetical protein